jgi:hypothetical protein
LTGAGRVLALASTMSAMMKILYNDSYGGFNFSDAFEAEYERRAGKKIREVCPYGPNKAIRADPVAVGIFEEKGTEWCSGRFSSLKLYQIPAVFARYWEIDEYDGDETVRVNVAEALADILETYMQTGDHAAMVDQYRHIKTAERQMVRSFREAMSAE